MENHRNYMQELTDIRSMMERTTKFLSLSGWAGIMAGVYALVGAYVAYSVFGFHPKGVMDAAYLQRGGFIRLSGTLLTAITVLVLAIITAIVLSYRKAAKRKEKFWNATSRRLLMNMSVPLVAGGVFIVVLILKGLIGLIVPVTLLFYGLSLYIAGQYTYEDVKGLGLIQIILGLLSACFVQYSLLFWALGFGAAHIIYGIYLHYKYER